MHLASSGIENVFALCMHSNLYKFAVRRLADDCSKYGANNQSSCPALATAVLNFSTSHSSIEDEREALLRILGDQVIEKSLVHYHLHTSDLLYYLYMNVFFVFLCAILESNPILCLLLLLPECACAYPDKLGSMNFCQAKNLS